MSDDLWATPPSWAWTTLDDVASWSSGGTPTSGEPSYYGGKIPWLIIGDLNDGVVTSSAKSITPLGVENSSAKYVEPGAVMIALYGSIGKLGIASVRCTTNQAIAFTKNISEAVEQPFLFRYLQNVRGRLLELGKGVGQPNISQTILKAFPICVAPLAEQRRIVAKLEKLLGQVDACQQRLEKMPTLLKRFRQSILAAACSGRLTADWREKNPQNDAELVDGIESDDLPEGWRVSTVEKLAKIGSGQSSKLIISKCGTAGEIPWFKVSDMNLEGNEKFMRSSQNYLGRDNAEALGMKIYPAGTIIFPKRGGAIATNKKRILIQPSCIDSNTMALIPHSCFGDYFWTWFTTMDLGILADGSSVPQINNPDIQPLEVPLPPLAEQQEIVRRVAGLFALADQLEQRLAQARKQVDKLTPSLLARAFAGQLVPQNPADEPAEKLLERIKINQSNG